MRRFHVMLDIRCLRREGVFLLVPRPVLERGEVAPRRMPTWVLAAVEGLD